MLAVIKTGGKQYKVKEGDFISVEKLALDLGGDHKWATGKIDFAEKKSIITTGVYTPDGHYDNPISYFDSTLASNLNYQQSGSNYEASFLIHFQSCIITVYTGRRYVFRPVFKSH